MAASGREWRDHDPATLDAKGVARYAGAARLLRAEGTEPFLTTADGEPTVQYPEPGEPVWVDAEGVGQGVHESRRLAAAADADDGLGRLAAAEIDERSGDRRGQLPDGRIELLARLRSEDGDGPLEDVRGVEAAFLAQQALEAFGLQDRRHLLVGSFQICVDDDIIIFRPMTDLIAGAGHARRHHVRRILGAGFQAPFQFVMAGRQHKDADQIVARLQIGRAHV